MFVLWLDFQNVFLYLMVRTRMSHFGPWSAISWVEGCLVIFMTEYIETILAGAVLFIVHIRGGLSW